MYILQHAGYHFSLEVIQQICPEVNQCTGVTQLAFYLNRRHVLNQSEASDLSKPNATGTMLGQALLQASREPSRGSNLIAALFLALLDMFHDTEDTWCHYTAFHVVGMYTTYIFMYAGTCTYFIALCLPQ